MAGSVPNLQRDHCVIDEDLFLAEVCADGWLRLASDFAIQVLGEEGSLSDTRISKYDYFEKVLFPCRHFRIDYF